MKSSLITSFVVILGVCVLGCSDDSSGGEVTKVEGTNSAKYATSSLTLPKNTMSSAFDLDGDGTADNKLGAIISGLAAVNLMPQASADDSVAKGSLVLLVEETSTDAGQTDAMNAGVKLSLAKAAAMPPKYDGTDTFQIDTSTSTAQFFGNISAGAFTSNNPANSVTPVTLTIALPLVDGQDALLIPVTAGRLTFKRGVDGKITGGQLNGALKKEDVDTKVLPAIAGLITQQVQAPDASAAIKMFDVDMDGTVTVAELKANALIANFLSPDIQLFDGGVYKPNPSKTNKDSLSLGLGFTAVGASF